MYPEAGIIDGEITPKRKVYFTKNSDQNHERTRVTIKNYKKYKATTNSKHSYPIHNNVLDRQFKVEKPNQVWVADITYIPTKEVWFM